MNSPDKNIEKKIDELLDMKISRVQPSASFTANVMKRFEEEVNKGKAVSMKYMAYIRVAAALIAFAVIGNLLILITSIKTAETTNEIITAYSSEYNIDNKDQWWINLASGDYYPVDSKDDK